LTEQKLSVILLAASGNRRTKAKPDLRMRIASTSVGASSLVGLVH